MARAKRNSQKKAPPGLPADRRRADLLEAAYVLIAEKGLEGLRTRDIAARAGVNISTLHYYFGTKEALVVAVVEHVSEIFSARPADPPGAPASVSESLRSHFESAWQSFEDNPHLATVLQELVLRAARDAPVRAAFRALHSSWNRSVEEILQRGIETGQLRADLDARAAARVVTSFIMGAQTQLSVNARAFDFGEVARELERWLETAAPRR